MKRIILILTTTIFLLISSCKNENKIPMAETIAAAKEYHGKEISSEFDVKINVLIAQMTIEEKIGMLHGNSMFATGGVERLGIPELKMVDGPLGIREEISKNSWASAGLDNDYATYYPAAGAVAATWDPELSYTFGNSVGQEARARGKDMLLSPAINIVRTPLGGRTYEYFTEDPFLNKKLAVPFIVGVQKNDIMACVKHFAVNNQETNRGTVDVLVINGVLKALWFLIGRRFIPQ